MSDRLNAEWLAVSAVRELAAMAMHDESSHVTYNDAITIAAEILPDLLGEDSLLGKGKAPSLAQEFIERARVKSLKDGVPVSAFDLVEKEIQEDSALIQYHKGSNDKSRVYRMKVKLNKLKQARDYLDPRVSSEHELIFRDAYNISRDYPSIQKGKSYHDYKIDEGKALRIRVLHPDKAEHILGADLIYERHSVKENLAAIAAVQYKIWDNKKMHLNDPRMQKQIDKLKKVFCNSSICKAKPDGFRFPCCSAFLRPTDKLQSASQALRSSGEHLPICLIDSVKTKGSKGGELLEWEGIKDVSLSGKVFEDLFVEGRVGSNWVSTSQLHQLYSEAIPDAPKDKVVIYAQEFFDLPVDDV